MGLRHASIPWTNIIQDFAKFPNNNGCILSHPTTHIIPMLGAIILFLSIGIQTGTMGSSSDELEKKLAYLEQELRKIPRWLDVILIMSEIRKVKEELSEFKMLEGK